jgi:hypothetical protein
VHCGLSQESQIALALAPKSCVAPVQPRNFLRRSASLEAQVLSQVWIKDEFMLFLCADEDPAQRAVYYKFVHSTMLEYIF